MKIPEEEIIDTIKTDGMLEIIDRWIPISCAIDVKKQTEKSYFGNLRIFATDHDIYTENDTWIPKSMSENPWWLCVVKMGHEGKVSNRRFYE